jgi:hypothetical protein
VRNPRQWLLPLTLFGCLALPACQRVPPLSGDAFAPPTFAYAGEGGGCAHIFLFKGTQDGTEFLTVSAEIEKLKLPAKGTRTFEIADVKQGLAIAVDLWEKKPDHLRYCNDIDDDPKLKAKWVAKRGKVTITLEEPAKGDNPNRTFKASVRLENIEFEDAAGHKATLKEESFKDVTVGWYAG